MKPILTGLTWSLLIILLYSCSSAADEPVQKNGKAKEEIIFEDDFSSFDSNIWNKETHPSGWVNEELQSYSPDNITVGKDGDKKVLIITAERNDDRIISGRVNTMNKMSFKYGKIEASIKLPVTANGLWPAFWMMGDNGRKWPECGEIDIMEMGSKEGIRNGNSTKMINTSLHYGTSFENCQHQCYSITALTNLQDGNYHIFAMEWSELNIKISVDGWILKTFLIKENPYFHDNFYVILNLAVGGLFTGISDVSEITAFPEGGKASMYIDWIRVIKEQSQIESED